MKAKLHTHPDVFILESLTLKDERTRRKDGLLLSRSLRMYGKKPIYYYFRTKRELEELAKLFRESRYRYLHISCHGLPSGLKTTFDSISYAAFAKIFSGCLNNRRLFMSACEVGNELFAITVKGTNGGMYSVVAPTNAISFNRSAAFWSAFYFLMFDFDSRAMKLATIKDRIGKISTLFDVHLHLSWNRAHKNTLVSMEFHPGTGASNETEEKGT